MKTYNKFIILISIAVIVFFTSCSTLEKASIHGFNSGYYKLESEKKAHKVYLNITDDKIDVYQQTENKPGKDIFLSIPFASSDSMLKMPLIFKKQSLDIDITTVLLKYRKSVYGLPGQLTSEFNASLYAGWRYDNFKIVRKMDPLGNSYHKIISHGYDIGFFAGPGVTQISPFTTQNKSDNEYSGMIIQTGIAGFLETNIASFGIAMGLDYLLNRDREIWIYNNKPWVGFIVGIAFN